MMSAYSSVGIYSIEGYWPTQYPSFSAALPVLNALKLQFSLPIIHRQPVTLMQFKKYVREWSSPNFLSYSILCLSFHGEAEKIFIGDATITLDDIEEEIEGCGHSRTIYFSTCETLNIDEERAYKFLNNTGLSRIAGYDTTISIRGSQIEDHFHLIDILSDSFGRSHSPVKRRKIPRNCRK